MHFIHSSPDFTSRKGAGPARQELDKFAADFVGPDGVKGRRLTLCELSLVGHDAEGKFFNTLSRGIGICHPNDVFSKPIGRKMALTSALVEDPVSGEVLTHQERADIWSAYFQEFGFPQK